MNKQATSRQSIGSKIVSAMTGASWVGAIALLAACSTPTRASSAITTTAARAQTSNDSDYGYGYQFDTDSTKNAGASPTSDLSLPHAAGDRIPPETIQALARARYGAVSTCYQAGLARNPSLAGTVTVKLVAAPSGATQQATDDGSTLPDQDVVACVVGALGTIAFPQGGGVLTVVYPIALAP